MRAAGVQGASNRVFNGFSVGVVSLATPAMGAGLTAPPGSSEGGGGVSAAAPAPAGAYGGLLSLVARPQAATGSAPASAAAAAASAAVSPGGAMLERAMARAAPQARRALAAASASALECAPSAAAPSVSAALAEAQLRAAMCSVAQDEMGSSAEAGQAASAGAMARLCALGAGGGGGGGALALPAYEAEAPLAAQAAAGGGEDGGLREALEGLRAEPASDADLAAGFAVFSAYLDKVVEIRGQALEVYADAGKLLPAEGRGALAASVAVLDDPANLAVADPPPGQWIVYGMAKQANRNHGVISALVHGLESKLALLQEAVDCPFCLEGVGGEGRAVHIVPACCHRTCGDCWGNWAQVCAAQGRAVFCPLCRGPGEFLEVLSPA